MLSREMIWNYQKTQQRIDSEMCSIQKIQDLKENSDWWSIALKKKHSFQKTPDSMQKILGLKRKTLGLIQKILKTIDLMQKNLQKTDLSTSVPRWKRSL